MKQKRCLRQMLCEILKMKMSRPKANIGSLYFLPGYKMRYKSSNILIHHQEGVVYGDPIWRIWARILHVL